MLCLFLCSSVSGNAACDILLLGDSLINGRHRLALPLAQYFKTNGGLAGAGYCSLVDSNGTADAAMVYHYGTSGWQIRKNAADAIGVDVTDLTGTVAGQEIQFLLRSDIDEIEFYYRAQPGGGSFSVYHGSELLVMVNTESDESVNEVHRLDWASRSSSTTIKLLITDPGESGVRLAGLNFLARDGAVRIHEMGTGGMTSGGFERVDDRGWINFVRELRPEIVCILLGTNDHSSNVAPAIFKSNIEALIERVRAARPYAQVLLISPSDNGLEDRRYEIEDYRDVLAEISIDQQVGFVDLLAQLGTYEEAAEEGLYSDLVHPNTAGGNYIRDAVLSMLNITEGGDINVINLWDNAAILETTDLSCEVGAEKITLHWRQFPGVNYTLKESVQLDSWTPVVMPATRGNIEQSIVLDRSNARFWKLEATYPLLWK